jgi:hypothetical protein
MILPLPDPGQIDDPDPGQIDDSDARPNHSAVTLRRSARGGSAQGVRDTEIVTRSPENGEPLKTSHSLHACTIRDVKLNP